MQPLVSSLSASDRLVQPLRKDCICTICVVDLLIMSGLRSKHVEEFNFTPKKVCDTFCSTCKNTRTDCTVFYLGFSSYFSFQGRFTVWIEEDLRSFVPWPLSGPAPLWYVIALPLVCRVPQRERAITLTSRGHPADLESLWPQIYSNRYCLVPNTFTL